MTQLQLDFSPPRRPRGKSGAVLEALLATSRANPLTPLDLAKEPGKYGTDCMRLLRFARQWIEVNTQYVVRDEKAGDGSHHRYWIEEG